MANKLVLIFSLSLLLFKCSDNRVVREYAGEGNLDKANGVVLIEGVNFGDLKSIVATFCQDYNGSDDQILPNLNVDAEGRTFITFRQPVDFEIFSYFINFLEYPFGFVHQPRVMGWTPIDSPRIIGNYGKFTSEVMIFVPDTDSQYDYVYFLNQNGAAFKNSFDVNRSISPVKAFDRAYVTFGEEADVAEIVKVVEFR